MGLAIFLYIKKAKFVKTNYEIQGEDVYYTPFLFPSSLYYKPFTPKSGISFIIWHTVDGGVLGLGVRPIAKVWFVPLTLTLVNLSPYLKINKGAIWSHLEPCGSRARARKHWDMNSWVTAKTNSIWLDDRQVQTRNKTLLSGSSAYLQIVFKNRKNALWSKYQRFTKCPNVLILDIILFIPHHGNILFTAIIDYCAPHILTFTMCVN